MRIPCTAGPFKHCGHILEPAVKLDDGTDVAGACGGLWRCVANVASPLRALPCRESVAQTNRAADNDAVDCQPRNAHSHGTLAIQSCAAGDAREGDEVRNTVKKLHSCIDSLQSPPQRRQLQR